MNTAEVIRNPLRGWDLKLRGEDAPRSSHESREQAVGAARKAVAVGEADEVVIREDRTSEPVDTAAGVRSALLYFSLMMIGVIALIAIVGLVLSLTGFAA